MMKKSKHEIKITFQVYCNNTRHQKSSVFDLISGDLETKQTKGLAYLLSQHSDFCLDFIMQTPIWSHITKVIKDLDIKQIKKITVCAENYTIEKRRADIILKIFDEHSLLFAIVIEAKSINAGNIDINNLKQQVNQYVENGKIQDLTNIRKFAMVLTKYKYDISDVICMEWNEVINFTDSYFKKHPECSIVNDYNEFLMNINKDMVIFDKEVLSLPAGRSIERIEKYYIYECPNKRNYKRPMYITFRDTRYNRGGEMRCLYKINDILVLNPCELKVLLQKGDKILDELDIAEEIKCDIIQYISDTPAFENEDNRFYILSKTDNIKLKEPYPKPIRNNANIAYYSLSEILNGELKDK